MTNPHVEVWHGGSRLEPLECDYCGGLICPQDHYVADEEWAYCLNHGTPDPSEVEE